ncbi:ankyrin repeat domain-containing protein 39 [Anopheles maculipalpis]|uniref:ankyrin repeat domain-containing protein 39 n=1 Tax=Anopheles maculipalpis TaxID=1496333 RepID=UPI0021599697|nr:ankyrin repeat domain-containing protein 39 [Anopheles maculipalpis]
MNPRSCKDHTNCSTKGIGATQSLNELDFDRGIWSAAMDNEIERLEKLIARGHLYDRDSCGYTALHYAARNGHFEACQLLLLNGLGVNEVTNGGVTALHRAAMMGHTRIMELLLSFRANAMQKDNDGRTALHRAAEGGHLKSCQLLVIISPVLRHVEDVRRHKPIDLVQDTHTDADLLRKLLAVPRRPPL